MDIKKIIGLPVYTENNFYLGRVVKIKVDSQTNQPIQYFVKSNNFIKNLFKRHLIINQSQVISISEEKMIVKSTFKRLYQTIPLPSE